MQDIESKKLETTVVQQPKENSLLPPDNIQQLLQQQQQARQQLQLKEELEQQLKQLQEQKPPPVPPHQYPLKQQVQLQQEDKQQHQPAGRSEDPYHQHQHHSRPQLIAGMGSPDNKKVLKKKMSPGNLRSPTVKRSTQAPVTMQGWLWKQGSDGFMRWKRRWFVLSDFCLFYYKGPEEDKILGSILLPSYAISPCPNENKVMKKFAFKAEHQNMRTYYFAADTKESLQQWLNVMSMATVLKKDGNSCQIYEDHLESSHCSDSHNTSTANEDEDSGFTSYHSRRYVGSPPDGSSPMNGSYTSDSLHLPDERYRDAPNDPSRIPHERNMHVYLGNNEKYPVPPYAHAHYFKNPKARQHLYANAPPKPRRLGADPYGTVGEPPSEQLIYNNGVSYHPEDFQDNQHDYPPPEYSAANKNVGSPANKEQIPGNRTRREDGYAHIQQAPWNPQVEYSGNPKEPNQYLETAGDPSGNFRNVENSNRIPRQASAQGQEQPCFQDEYDPAVLRQKGQRLYHAQRPHSANFLEYDNYEKQPENMYDQDSGVARRVGKENAMRPKSSIEQYGTPPNYWNEIPHHNMPPPHTPHTNPQAWGIMEQSPMSEQNGWYPQNPQQQYVQQPHNEYYSDAKYVTSVEMISPRVARETRAAAQKDPQFMRSASARLPSSAGSRPVQDVEGLPMYSHDDLTDNDPKRLQQREESMKRLLEWKQRMLQSPFTKKHQQKLIHQEMQSQSQSPSSSDDYRKPPMVKNDTSAQEIPSQHHVMMPGQVSDKSMKHHESNMKLEENKKRNDEKNARPTANPANERIVYQPPPSIHASARIPGDGKPSIAMMNQYRSSYSSDDEESGSGSFKGLYLSRTQPRRRNKSDLILEEPNSSDPELHLRNTQSLKHPKYGKQPDTSDGNNSRLNLSAGDLLGKTHEELILLLIQLRRTQSRLQKAIDTCRMELEGEKKLIQIDVKNRESHSRKVEELTMQLEEYLKQSDVNIPLVNLVDNMVKLGSLYGDSDYLLSAQNQIPLEHYSPPNKMIEFTRRLQEQRLAQNDWPEWRQLVPDQKLLQDKLQHLYMLDRSLQDESVVLTNLQQDKEMLERALAGIHMKADANRSNTTEQERLMKQQRLVENELGKVQMQLTSTTKKLEETATENTKIEREILLLRQKIQNTIRRTVPNPAVYVEDSETVQLKVQLEEELAHVQNIMEELSKRRTKINGAVQQLKDDEQKKLHEVRPSPTGVSGSAPLPGRKHARSTYLETDLDTLETRDALDLMVIDETKQPPVAKPRRTQIPLYVNSNNIENKMNGSGGNKLLAYLPDRKEVEEFMEEQDTFCQDINEADEKMKRFYGILPRDKPSEVKTVRIVKRESERRNKTKDRGRKMMYDEQQLTRVLEEPDTIVFEDFDYIEDIRAANDFQRSMSLPRNYGRACYIPMHPPDSLALNTTAISSVSSTPTSSSKVLPNVPYYYRTPSLSVHARSRDDLDMERCLRSANTPDVVKSTIKKTETNFDESTIDRELGLPDKIVIPERYVEQEEEELTEEEKLHRMQKAESIKKMLSETTTYGDLTESEIANASETLKKKFGQEKKQREQLLSLNQLLAQEVKERSKAVAAHKTYIDT